MPRLLEYTDYHVGRIVEAFSRSEFDDTLIYYIIGDNGASAEGGQRELLNEMSYFNMVPASLNGES